MFLGKCWHQLLEDRASVDYRDEERCRTEHLLAIVTRDSTDCDSSIFFSGGSFHIMFVPQRDQDNCNHAVIKSNPSHIASHMKPVRLSPRLMFKLMRKLAET